MITNISIIPLQLSSLIIEAIKVEPEEKVLQVRLVSPGSQLGHEAKEVSAVLAERLVLSLDPYPVVLLVTRHPRRNEGGELCDGGENVTDNFHHRSSFGVEQTSKYCSVQILLMSGDEIIQTCHLVQEIVLKLAPGNLQHLGGDIVVEVPDEMHHFVPHQVHLVQHCGGRLLVPSDHQVLVGPVQLEGEHGQPQLQLEVQDGGVLGHRLHTQDDVLRPGRLVGQAQTRDPDVPLTTWVEEEGQVLGHRVGGSQSGARQSCVEDPVEGGGGEEVRGRAAGHQVRVKLTGQQRGSLRGLAQLGAEGRDQLPAKLPVSKEQVVPECSQVAGQLPVK